MNYKNAKLYGYRNNQFWFAKIPNTGTVMHVPNFNQTFNEKDSITQNLFSSCISKLVIHY